MPPRSDPEYYLDEATGQLFFGVGGSRTIVGDIDLSVVWTTDEDGNGCLHKHGSKDLVAQKAAVIMAIDETTKAIVIPWEAIKHPEAGPLILEEINKCLSISGRVSKIEAFMTDLSGKYDIEVFPRFTSDASDTSEDMTL
jgi:hypothetical protein